MTGDEIRKAFLTFFAQRGHKVLPSSSLVPDDPTTLFTTAGMQQFVPWFRREVEPPYGSVATVQKCLRTDDLDNVGRKARYHTFFEMLGNFSFGDYFKQETLRWGWEFTTLPREQGGLGFDPERVWVTYYKPLPGEPYQEDLEARQIWREIGVPEERIIPLGKKENWWGPVGDSGPCGPCSEMHYDRGAHLACGPECTSPACGCDRWLEFWNHVFQQFNYQDGQYQPLPAPGIDTGAGLERIASLVQDVETNYDTDLVSPIMDAARKLAGITNPTPEQTLALRVIGDHLRCVSFMIADGVLPSNNRRGYVVRRVTRRAFRFGRALGITEPFLYKLVPTLVSMMGNHYRELRDNAHFITDTLRAEEERFADTLERGEDYLTRLILDTKRSVAETMLQAMEPSVLERVMETLAKPVDSAMFSQVMASVKKAFESSTLKQAADILSRDVDMVLFRDMAEVLSRPVDTSGLKRLSEVLSKDVDLSLFTRTSEAVSQAATLRGEDVFTLYDTYGFPKELTEETARAAGLAIDEEGYAAAMEKARDLARAGGKFAYQTTITLGPEIPPTEFLGYQATEAAATLVHFEASEDGDSAVIVLDKTPFYATSGGQCTDFGTLSFDHATLPVVDVTKDKYGHVMHVVDLSEHEAFYPGPHHTITAKIDVARRNAIRRAHTATHLLHWALHNVLGEHAKQAGSLVEEDTLRFDFSQPRAMTEEEIRRVEALVYDKVLEDAPVSIRDMSLEEARKEGYTALFGEKYGDWVRTVNIGGGEADVAFSRELCGGTHLDRTGQVGYIRIIAESSVAAGIRRIEALTGKKAAAWATEQAAILRDLSNTFKAPVEELSTRVDSLQRELREAQTRINELKVKVAAGGGDGGPQPEEIGGVKVVIAQMDGLDADTLGSLADQYVNNMRGGVAVLASATDGKVLLAVKVSKDLTGRFHAGNIIREVAKVTGGGGGGRPDFAQAGGRDASKVPDALRKAREMIGG